MPLLSSINPLGLKLIALNTLDDSLKNTRMGDMYQSIMAAPQHSGANDVKSLFNNLALLAASIVTPILIVATVFWAAKAIKGGPKEVMVALALGMATLIVSAAVLRLVLSGRAESIGGGLL